MAGEIEQLLDNSSWDGQFWWPAREEVELMAKSKERSRSATGPNSAYSLGVGTRNRSARCWVHFFGRDFLVSKESVTRSSTNGVTVHCEYGPCSVGRVFCVSSAMLVTRGGGDIGAGSRAPLLCEKDWIFSGAPPVLLAWCGGLEGWMPPFAVTSRERRFCSTGNSLIASPDLVVARTAVLALLSEMLTQANGTCRSGAMR